MSEKNLTFLKMATFQIKWNFTKFVVDRDGNVVARFEPTADMSKVEECIKELL